MREEFHSRLSEEITRKQFVQYLVAATLGVFGVGNLLALLTGSKRHHTTIVIGDSANSHHGFGSRKFGA